MKMISLTNMLKENWILLGILLLALLLRLIGITHGYPYILNIDEPTIVRSTMGLFFSSDINHFDWPHFNYYFHYPFYIAFIKFRGLIQIIGFRGYIENVFPILWNDPFVFYVISRSITAIMSALTVIPVYLIGKEIFDRRVGLISSLFFAITPYLVFSSHFTMQDGVILFWTMWGVLFAYYAARYNQIKYFIFTGAAFAFASGVKYNAVLVALILPVFVVYRVFYDNQKGYLNEIKRYIIPFLIFGITFVALFLITNPRIVIDWGLFWSYERGKGFLWQLKENSNPVSLYEYPYYLLDRTHALIISMGVSIPILFISSLFLSRKEKYQSKRWVLYPMIIISISILLFTARYERSGAHYFLSIFGIIIIVAGFSFISILDDYIKKYKILFNLVVFLPIIYFTTISFSKFIVQDTRREALDYYQLNKENKLPTFYLGNDFSEINGINNLGLKKFLEEEENTFVIDSYILSEKELGSNDRIMEVAVIRSNIYKRGPNVYVYQFK